MLRPSAYIAIAAVALSACVSSQFDEAMISEIPADASSLAIAQQAVKACASLPDEDGVSRSFKQAGFQVSKQPVALSNGRETERMLVKAPNENVSVLVHGNNCYVGVVGMTPGQSVELAQHWVSKFKAHSNSAHGDGSAEQVAGAWRKFENKVGLEHTVFIAAYKSWPTGPYDPQRNVAFSVSDLFPNVPGAAVKLNYIDRRIVDADGGTYVITGMN